jgi:hypothetical protein
VAPDPVLSRPRRARTWRSHWSEGTGLRVLN